MPLQTARACVQVAELAGIAASRGNSNAVTDAGVAGLLAQAAGEGALWNVQINLKSMPESADKTVVGAELTQVRAALHAAAGAVRSTVETVMSA